MKRIHCTHDEAGFTVEAEALMLGNDVAISLWGGTRPHVGAVAMAIPRPSLKDSRVMSATASVLTSPGHKEDVVVKWFSEKAAAALNCTVVVSAGMHWDDLTGADLGVIQQANEALFHSLIDQLKEAKA